MHASDTGWRAGEHGGKAPSLMRAASLEAVSGEAVTTNSRSGGGRWPRRRLAGRRVTVSLVLWQAACHASLPRAVPCLGCRACFVPYRPKHSSNRHVVPYHASCLLSRPSSALSFLPCYALGHTGPTVPRAGPKKQAQVPCLIRTQYSVKLGARVSTVRPFAGLLLLGSRGGNGLGQSTVQLDFAALDSNGLGPIWIWISSRLGPANDMDNWIPCVPKFGPSKCPLDLISFH